MRLALDASPDRVLSLTVEGAVEPICRAVLLKLPDLVHTAAVELAILALEVAAKSYATIRALGFVPSLASGERQTETQTETEDQDAREHHRRS